METCRYRNRLEARPWPKFVAPAEDQLGARINHSFVLSVGRRVARSEANKSGGSSLAFSLFGRRREAMALRLWAKSVPAAAVAWWR